MDRPAGGSSPSRHQQLRAVAHDFSNILGAMLNYAQFIEEEAAAAVAGGAVDADDLRRWHGVLSDARQIAAAAHRGAELTERLREIAGPPSAEPAEP